MTTETVQSLDFNAPLIFNANVRAEIMKDAVQTAVEEMLKNNEFTRFGV